MSDNKWISVKEELPDEYEEVLAYDKKEKLIHLAKYVPKWLSKSRWRIAYYGLNNYVLDKVTHWQPLPEPPDANS